MHVRGPPGADGPSEVELPEGADFYLCGGNGFLQAVRGGGQLEQQGIGRSRGHFELFNPNDWLLDA